MDRRRSTSLWLVGTMVLACARDEGRDPVPTQGGDTTWESTTAGSGPTAGTQTSTTGSTTSEVSESTSAVETTCPRTHRCVDRPPSGWAGPGLHRPTAGADADPCPSSYPEAESLGGADLLAPTARCDCRCGDATDMTCEASGRLSFYGDDATCRSVPETMQLFTTLCNRFPSPRDAETYWTLDPVRVRGGSCAPVPTAVVEPANFITTATACRGTDIAMGCDETELCTPVEDEPLCVWQDGDLPCPPSWDASRWVYQQDISDTRSCTACTCGTPRGLCDDAYALVYTDTCNFPFLATSVAATGTCRRSDSEAVAAVFQPGSPVGFCEPSESTPTGAATGSSPITVCCDS